MGTRSTVGCATASLGGRVQSASAPCAHVGLDNLPDVLTVPEACAVLRIGRNTGYDLARMGVIPTIRLGRRLLVPKLALMRMLDPSLGGPCQS